MFGIERAPEVNRAFSAWVLLDFQSPGALPQAAVDIPPLALVRRLTQRSAGDASDTDGRPEGRATRAQASQTPYNSRFKIAVY